MLKQKLRFFTGEIVNISAWKRQGLYEVVWINVYINERLGNVWVKFNEKQLKELIEVEDYKSISLHMKLFFRKISFNGTIFHSGNLNFCHRPKDFILIREGI